MDRELTWTDARHLVEGLERLGAEQRAKREAALVKYAVERRSRLLLSMLPSREAREERDRMYQEEAGLVNHDTPIVMVVDDEETQRNGLASMITSWGFTAETANGQDALEKLNKDLPRF